MVIIMELENAIRNRRSIRKYLDEEVDNKILFQAIEMGVKAPSAHNRQPWKFKILTKTEKNKIADALYDKTCNIVGHTGPHTAGVMKEIPSLIMVFIDNDISENRDMDVISIGACIENIILYLTSIDLGTLWIANTNLISDEIKTILDVPYENISCIGVGYKNQDPHERPRKNMEDVIMGSEKNE